MTFHRWSFARRGVVMAVLAVLAGYAVAGASAAAPPPGMIHSGTSLSDGRIARDSELRTSDFPGKGWFSTPGPTSLGHSQCAGVNDAQAAVSGSAISPQFTGKDATSVESTTYVYGDAKTASHWFGQLTSSSTRACVVRAVHESTVASTRGEGVTVGPVRVHRLPAPPVGDQASEERLSVRVSSGGIGLDAVADLIFVRVGRGVVVFDFAAIGSPFNRGLESKLMHDVASRLARDFAGGE